MLQRNAIVLVFKTAKDVTNQAPDRPENDESVETSETVRQSPTLSLGLPKQLPETRSPDFFEDEEASQGALRADARTRCSSVSRAGGFLSRVRCRREASATADRAARPEPSSGSDSPLQLAATQ
jgi:hypothetical protein